MKLTNAKTANNGAYQYGKMRNGNYSTNLWHDSWYEISDPSIKSLIDEIGKLDYAGDTANLEIKIKELNSLSKVGTKQVRANGNRKAKMMGTGGTSATCGATSTPTYTDYEELKEMTEENLSELEEPVVEETTTKEKDYRSMFMGFVGNLNKFFSEWIDPQESMVGDRFIDTILRQKDMTDYVRNYYKLQNHPNANDIEEKMRSGEFDRIIELGKQLKNDYEKTDQINKRLKVYYGPAGSGKTTQALKESTDGIKIVCSNDMLPSDMLKTFTFKDGQPQFEHSALYDAIVNGKTIVLDEINLLPLQSLRFLQGLTDQCEKVTADGMELTIHPNFKIIGTMNLVVNGTTYELPSPLVDRCGEIRFMSGDSNTLVNRLVEKMGSI